MRPPRNAYREILDSARKDILAHSARVAAARAGGESLPPGDGSQGDQVQEASGVSTVRFTVGWSLVDSATELAG